MIVNKWIVIAPGGDRPYVSSTPPVSLERTSGMQVFRAEVEVPEPIPVDGVWLLDRWEFEEEYGKRVE